MSKELIELTTTVDDKERKYTGRFLGFIKDDEFNGLVQNVDDVAAKLESKATQPLIKVAQGFGDVTGYRLVMTIKKIDGENCLKKSLYITERLSLIDSVVPKKARQWDNKTQGYKEAEPGKVTFEVGDGDDNIVVQEIE